MNYYILLIDIVLFGAILFSLLTVLCVIKIAAYFFTHNIDHENAGHIQSFIVILFTAFLWALHDYLIFSQV